MKRLFDILAAVLGLLILFPFFLVVAILIKRECAGPVFYYGPRAGRRGKAFRILKFRTMYERPESYHGACITAHDDKRITPLGRRLRDTKLNEIPQLWNVLKGEMSLVGPRPEDPEVVKTWPEGLRREILSVRPGITSPASVLYRQEEKVLNTESVMSDYLEKILPDKLRLDLLYVRTHSFLLDIDIILYTLIAFLPKVGQNLVSENKLYSGLLHLFFWRYLLWFMIDTLIALGATVLVGIIWRMSAPLNFGIWFAVGLAVGIGFLFGLINSLLGLKRVSWGSASPVRIFDLALSSFVSTLLVFQAGKYYSGPYPVSSGMIIEIGLVAFLGFVIVRYRQRLFTGLAFRWLRLRRHKNVIGERVLIVGAGEGGQLAGWLLKKSDLASAFTVVGMVDDDPEKYHMLIDEYKVLGTTREIPDLVKRMNIGVIMYAISKISAEERKRILKICRSQPVRVVVVPDLIKIIQDQFMKPYEHPVDPEQE